MSRLTDLCPSWSTHVVIIQEQEVVVKINQENREHLVQAPPEVVPFITGELKQLWRNYADLTFAEFLLRMFPNSEHPTS